MGSAHSGHGLGWTVGLTAGAFFAAGVVALAAGTSGTGAADGGIPDNPIPLVGTCSGDPPPCTLANGRAGGQNLPQRRLFGVRLRWWRRQHCVHRVRCSGHEAVLLFVHAGVVFSTATPDVATRTVVSSRAPKHAT